MDVVVVVVVIAVLSLVVDVVVVVANAKCQNVICHEGIHRNGLCLFHSFKFYWKIIKGLRAYNAIQKISTVESRYPLF